MNTMKIEKALEVSETDQVLLDAMEFYITFYSGALPLVHAALALYQEPQKQANFIKFEEACRQFVERSA